MAGRVSSDFVAGVIEGYYGQPWSRAERFELFDQMAAWGLDTYMYGPKDDLHHRAAWRQPYAAPMAETLGELIQTCTRRGFRFIYAIGPGLDFRYGDPVDLEALQARFRQLLDLGCHHFALLFDDIPDRISPEALQRWGSLAGAQCAVVNEVRAWTLAQRPDARFFFCPTPYCGRMARARHGGEGYLADVGRLLHPDVDVFWTGPEIISREITVDHLREIQALLRRKPVIWDNLHANDYDGRRFYCGPYAGRPKEILGEVRGILTNPNNEFPLNFVAFRTLARFVNESGPWDPRAEYLLALREWHPRFAVTGSQPVTIKDLVLLGDCYYLPHEEGPEAEELHRQLRGLLARPPSTWGADADAFRTVASRLRDTCARLAELRDRPLFYALSRRIWELREELDLLEKYVLIEARGGLPPGACTSDFHLPGTYRGGMVPRLQRLLQPRPDGSFRVVTPTDP